MRVQLGSCAGPSAPAAAGRSLHARLPCWTPQRPCRLHHAAPLQAHKSDDEAASASVRPAESSSLNLPYQSEADKSSVQKVVKTTGLHRAPLSGGVRSATLRCSGQGQAAGAWAVALACNMPGMHTRPLHTSIIAAMPQRCSNAGMTSHRHLWQSAIWWRLRTTGICAQ